MIKEFWQERKNEKKRLKEEKKNNRKSPKTKEQIAYKVFGILFSLFLIFGSIGYSCTISCSGGYSWDDLIGVNDEISLALSQSVNIEELIPDGQLAEYDWSSCIAKLNDAKIDFVTDFNLDSKKVDVGATIESNLNLTNRELGALLSRYVSNSNRSSYLSLLDFKVYNDQDNYYIQSVIELNLKKYMNSNLPNIYLTSISLVSTYDRRVYVSNTSIVINQLQTDMNKKVLDVLGNNIVDIDILTNELLITYINSFATSIKANVILLDGILFVSK